jgi:hypothetical protein
MKKQEILALSKIIDGIMCDEFSISVLDYSFYSV